MTPRKETSMSTTLLKTTFNLLIAVMICTSASNAQTTWNLVWSDEFTGSNGAAPNSANWTYDTGGGGWGNNELEYYTRDLKNAHTENGNLIIEARKESQGGREFTSARLVSKNKGDWKYGRIEVRAKLPRGLGTWPAIWMLADSIKVWPDDGEIDIMEHVGFHPGYIHGSIHCKKYNHIIGTQKTDTLFVPDCSSSFHVYSIEWDKDSMHVAVDGNAYFNFANEKKGYEYWPFDNKMFLILNIAVGGNWGGQQGVDDSKFPMRMEIDYVRVYQKNETK